MYFQKYDIYIWKWRSHFYGNGDRAEDHSVITYHPRENRAEFIKISNDGVLLNTTD